MEAWVLCDSDPVPDWVDGPVVLLGDAAHPMPQYAAQGGSEALEDAVLLGDLLDRVGVDFGDWLEKCNAVRRERSSKTRLYPRTAT
jgi:salicylate hydroxylase